jgi:hypothetical protein
MFTFQPGSDLVAKPLHVSPFMVWPLSRIIYYLIEYGIEALLCVFRWNLSSDYNI